MNNPQYIYHLLEIVSSEKQVFPISPLSGVHSILLLLDHLPQSESSCGLLWSIHTQSSILNFTVKGSYFKKY